MFRPAPTKYTIMNETKSTIEIDILNAAKKLAESKASISVSDLKSTTTTSVAQILSEAKTANKPVIFTVTPGPFIDIEKELGEDYSKWMACDDACGCKVQLDTFNAAVKKLGANIYAINNKNSDYQTGEKGVLKAKNLTDLSMISVNEALQKEWSLPTIQVGSHTYLRRFAIVIRPDGKMQTFNVPNRGTSAQVNEVINEIELFITPNKVEEAKSQATLTPTPVN